MSFISKSAPAKAGALFVHTPKNASGKEKIRETALRNHKKNPVTIPMMCKGSQFEPTYAVGLGGRQMPPSFVVC